MTNDNDGNLLGRVLALALILGAAYGATSISKGRMCPLGNGRCCEMTVEKAKPAAPAAEEKPAAPVEKDEAPAEAPVEKADQ